MRRLSLLQGYFILFHVLSPILSFKSEGQVLAGNTSTADTKATESIQRVKRQRGYFFCPGHDGITDILAHGYVPWHAEIYHTFNEG